ELCSREHELDRSTMREMLVGPNFGDLEACLLFALPRCVFAVANILPEGIFSANQMMRIVPTLTAVPFSDIQPVVGGDEKVYVLGPHSVHRPVVPCLNRVNGTAVLKSSINEGRELVFRSCVTPWLPAIARADVCSLVVASGHRLHNQLSRLAIAANEVLRSASRGDPI